MKQSIRLVLVILLLGVGGMSAHAQFGGLLNKVKQKVKDKVEQKVDRTIDQTIDSAEEKWTIP
ncbi:hypothetical protein [Bacteroides heparinolyticus]|uniref:hypothetical protein n=1 Tax=Prevotella heparinolytica TaxID=28113 RepID=UPI00359F7E13